MATRPLRIGAAGCENDQADSEHTVGLLENLPEVERVRNSLHVHCRGSLCQNIVSEAVVKGVIVALEIMAVTPLLNHLYAGFYNG